MLTLVERQPRINPVSLKKAMRLYRRARALMAAWRSLARQREALARLDDRLLADIGLNRSDLRDAYAGPLWHDPSELLARRAVERRARHGNIAVTFVPQMQHQTPRFGAEPMLSHPVAGRSRRHLH